MAINFKDLVGGGGGFGVIPSVKTVDGPSFNEAFQERLVFGNVNCSGAGQTFTATGKFVLLGLAFAGGTSNDSKYSVTIDGEVRARWLDSFSGAAGNNVIYDPFITRTSPVAALVAGGGIQAPIIVNESLDFFIQTNTDTDITVYIGIARIA
jgi:hypothetical protein